MGVNHIRSGLKECCIDITDKDMSDVYVSDNHNKKVYSRRTESRFSERKGNKLRNTNDKFKSAKKTVNRTSDNVNSEQDEDSLYEQEATS